MVTNFCWYSIICFLNDMANFHVILCAFFLQLRSVLGLIFLVRVHSSNPVVLALVRQDNFES